MSTRNLYLYEVVDVVGQGQYAYMEHLWQDPVLRMPEMFGLQGSFYVCAAAGGRWPQVVNIWEFSPAFRKLLYSKPVVEAISQLTGQPDLQVWHDQTKCPSRCEHLEAVRQG